MITTIGEAREEIGRLNGEIGRLHGELAASMRSVIDERDEARRERDVARACLVDALAQRDGLREKRNALEIAYNAANELRAAIRRERDEARAERDDAQRRVTADMDVKRGMVVTINDLRSDRDKARRYLNEIVEALGFEPVSENIATQAEVLDEIGLLRSTLAEVKAERDELRGEIDKGLEHLETSARLRKERDEAQAEVAELRADLARHRQSWCSVEELEHVKGGRDLARKDRDALIAERNDLVNKLANMTTERDRERDRAERCEMNADHYYSLVKGTRATNGPNATHDLAREIFSDRADRLHGLLLSGDLDDVDVRSVADASIEDAETFAEAWEASR